jgi:GDPmannose 4,6-dehydratase
MERCLITGITGQDGSILAEMLCDKGCDVHGIIRRGSTINTGRIDHLIEKGRITEHYGDLGDANSIYKLLMEIKPDEIYNMGSQSQVRISFDIPEYTGDITGLGVCRLLEATKNLIKHDFLKKDLRIYHASSSEMYGLSKPPQNESTTLMLPVSPYGAAKLYAFSMCRTYRLGYHMFVCTGILFNHEGRKRGETFLTKKVIRKACRIKLGRDEKLYLGNLYSKRDWGSATDYMDAVYKIMHHSIPDEFVVATNEYFSAEEFVNRVFKRLNLDVSEHVVIEERLFRPNEVPELRGDFSKIRDTLGWSPKMNLDDIIEEMISSVMDEEKKKLYFEQQDHEKERFNS